MDKRSPVYAFLYLLNSEDIYDIAYEVEIMSLYSSDEFAWVQVNSVNPYVFHNFNISHGLLRYLCLKLAKAYGFNITNAKEVMEKANRRKNKNEMASHPL